ncbi:MAG: c-type cytochrome [Myxococcales bacterium]|nr:c-type cytochrome [Myxococcales bacterium]
MSGILHDPKSYHSHKGLYIKTATILTVVTAAEIGLLFVEALKFAFVPLLVIMAVYKFAVVVGTFMHLKDDKTVFRVVFIAPLFMAMAMIYVLGLLVMPHFAPFGAGEVRLAVQKSKDERMGTGDYSPAAIAARDNKMPHLTKEKYAAMFASTKDFTAGEKVWGANCASCHRKDGGGLPGLGPNMTDDCYLHGGDVYSLVNTVTNGVKGKAMIAFKAQLSEEEIDQVALYVRKMRGTNVAKGKKCEGDKVAAK